MHNRFQDSPERDSTLRPSQRITLKHVNRTPLYCVFCMIITLVIFILCLFFIFSMRSPTAAGHENSQILVPKLDEREYKRILLPNLIQTILISDPKSKTASAAVSVGVGSNQNPREINGLAHLLEHMLFLGSSKYPDGNLLQKTAELGGGYTNAYTSPEETNFYFISGENEFNKSVDIFSWFFRDPTLDSNSIQKEIENVDSEHRKNLNSDNWKAMRLIRLIADEEHTYHDFATGTRDTLWNIPLEKGVNMSQTLREFYDSHYSANLMKLVIIGNNTLEELEEIANDKFVSIPNKFKRPSK